MTVATTEPTPAQNPSDGNHSPAILSWLWLAWLLTNMVEHRQVCYGDAFMLVATMVGQVTWVLLAYRARLETFVIQPGRFEGAQALLGSDVFVFLVPLVIAIVALAALLSRQIQSRRSTIYTTAVAAAIAAELVAVFVAFNAWGT